MLFPLRTCCSHSGIDQGTSRCGLRQCLPRRRLSRALKDPRQRRFLARAPRVLHKGAQPRFTHGLPASGRNSRRTPTLQSLTQYACKKMLRRKTPGDQLSVVKREVEMLKSATHVRSASLDNARLASGLTGHGDDSRMSTGSRPLKLTKSTCTSDVSKVNEPQTSSDTDVSCCRSTQPHLPGAVSYWTRRRRREPFILTNNPHDRVPGGDLFSYLIRHGRLDAPEGTFSSRARKSQESCSRCPGVERAEGEKHDESRDRSQVDFVPDAAGPPTPARRRQHRSPRYQAGERGPCLRGSFPEDSGQREARP
jgi:hypothetical protein